MMPFPSAMLRGGNTSFVSPAFPALPSSADVDYWFRADTDVFKDGASTPATDNDTVQVWGNNGNLLDAQQSTSGNRLTLKTGGLGGMPYLEAVRASPKFFEDLAMTAPSGFTTISPWRSFAFVVDGYVDEATNECVIFGSAALQGGKSTLCFNSTGVRWQKDGCRGGAIAKPMIVVCSTVSETVGRIVINGTYTADVSDGSNSISTAITQVQFLRSTGRAAGNQNFDGRLYEVIAWGNSAILSQTDMESVSASLNAIYEIY